MDFVCPRCEARYRIPDSLPPLREDLRGRIACRECGNVVPVGRGEGVGFAEVALDRNRLIGPHLGNASRVSRRRSDVGSERPENARTKQGEDPLLGPRLSARLPVDAQREFIRRYPIIKQHLDHHRELGLLALAFDDDDVAVGSAWVRATPDRTRAIVVGRHSACQLALPQSYEEVPLRHLAVIARAKDHDEVRFRVIDLATGVGFRDEHGELYEGLVAESPVFLRVGRVVLMLLTTNPELSASADAEQAFAEIPERVFIKAQPGVAPKRQERRTGKARRLANVTAIPGPLTATHALEDAHDAPAGFVEIRDSNRTIRKAVGESVLRRGLLIGRYDRCDIGLSDDHTGLSRVHLLILRHDDRIIAVDTASYLGTYVEGRRVDVVELRHGVRCSLANEIEVTWLGV